MSRSPRRAGLRRHALGVATLALAAGGALAGCGVSDDAIRPGVAAQVGEVSIGVDEVDEAVDGACVYFAANDADVAVVQARGTVRAQLLTLLMQRAAAEQLLEETGAELDPGYGAAVAADDARYEDESAEARAGLHTGNEAGIFSQAALVGIGTVLLEEEGVAATDPAAAAQRGAEAFADWIDSNEIDVNPLFAVEVVDGQFVDSTGDDLSVPTGEFASGTAGPDASGLPADQTCG